MKLWITVSEWYPVRTLAHRRDIGSSSDIKVEVPEELWDRWKLMKRQFESMQTELKNLYYKQGGTFDNC